MTQSPGLRPGRKPPLTPHSMPAAPVPAGRLAPFVLLRQVEGDVLITPFPKRECGPSPEETAQVKAVAGRLARDLPAGCFWIDAQNGQATPAAIAVPVLQRRLLNCTSFDVRLPWRSAPGVIGRAGWMFSRAVNMPRAQSGAA